jgi:LuxR family maltose regulon positive regulatory protein
MDQPRFVLKSTPPRAHRNAIARPRLDALWEAVHERALIEVCAAGGFGKSTLMVQWRRRWLERGALVAWLALDAEDAPSRFAGALAHTMRVASGRTAFDRIGVDPALDPQHALDALTALLSEVATLATPTVMMLDDAERMPADSVRGALSYVLLNAPSNLTLVVGTRIRLDLSQPELASRGLHALVSTEDLRLDADESVALLRKRFGKRMEIDDCVRLHEMTEGWPIGLQLAAAAVERAPHYHTAVVSLSARQGDIERYFIESLIDRLPPQVAGFLTRIAILDSLSPELCEATTGDPSSRTWLEQVMTDTPIVTVAELRGWMRLHALARDFLVGRFEQLPAEEKTGLHRRAAAWLAEHDRLPEASEHALAAGDADVAQGYALRSLWTLGTAGHMAEALRWLDRITPEALAADPGLRLVAAWIMAFSDRAGAAREIAAEALADSTAPRKVAFVAALVACAAEGAMDRVGAVAPIIGRWPEYPDDLEDPVHRVAYANTRSLMGYHDGDTGAAHALDALPQPSTANRNMLLALALGRMFSACAYLREADPLRVEEILHASLVHAERTLGRRSNVACMYAACLAEAQVERNEIARAEATLAHRMDVVERFVFPDPILAASRALARLAMAQGDERRALAVLDNLATLGRDRDIPRFTLVSLTMRAELHAVKGHRETAAALLPEIDALASVFDYPEYQPFMTGYTIRRSVAHAYVAIARFDAARADRELAVAGEAAARSNRLRDELTVRVLRAVAAHVAKSDRAEAMLAEALSIAAMRGCLRVAEDTHPIAVQMRDEADARTTGQAAGAPAPVRPAAVRQVAAAGGLLTPKEAEVLQLLAAGHSNKHIARTMDVSDETVKWHLKNLFSKLSAGTRRHAVDRARMMGLIAADAPLS